MNPSGGSSYWGGLFFLGIINNNNTSVSNYKILRLDIYQI